MPGRIPMKRQHIFAPTLFLLVSAVGFSQGQVSPLPAFALGQPKEVSATNPKSSAPNLVEGAELNSPQSVAVDPNSGALYVSDTSNNRVLGWRNAATAANGARADIAVGQRDRYSTGRGGPGTSLQSGLSQPTGLAVNANGDLFVVDAGNNRILRFPRPFDQPDDLKFADLVIGQSNMFTNGANQGGLSATSMDTTAKKGVAFRTTLAFDAAGNLWFTDSGNNRVLRYPAASIGAGATDGPAADLVLGQPNMTTNQALPRNFNSRPLKQGLRLPGGLAIDAAGRVFVTDELLRAVVFEPPFNNGKAASRVMGLVVVGAGEEPPQIVNERSIGALQGNVWRPADGVFTIGNIPFIVDTPANRILRYQPFDQWPAETTEVPSPAAEAVIGQNSLSSATPLVHRGRIEPGADTLFEPVGACAGPGNKVYVADSGNNRALVFPDLSTGPVSSVGPPYAAEKVFGQRGFPNRTPNRIEGREFFFTSNLATGGDVVIDWRSDPPHMYVADPNNHRVLGFKDARRVRNGTFADIVIGQPGFFRSLPNYPSGKLSTPNSTGLVLPMSVEVDNDGNLYVADFGNGRVLRFLKPFNQPPGLQSADLVLGQFDFTSRITDASARTMNGPSGLAFTPAGSLLVSDSAHNRVLVFDKPFRTGMAASRVFGQPDFSTNSSGNSLAQMKNPRGISVDASNRLYVADTGNNRVLVFGNINQAPGNGVPAALALTKSIKGSLKGPIDVFVSRSTGKAWVTNTNGAQVARYQDFDRLAQGAQQPEFGFSTFSNPLSVTEDQYGNLYIADALNRVVGHFKPLAATNGANFLQRVAPGMIATLWFAPDDSIPTGGAVSVPLPKEISDVAVLVNGEPAPLYFVSKGQINFLLPNGLPSTGTVEIVIVRVSTLQIVASSVLPLDIAAPGLFTVDQSGSGQTAALNQNNTINSPSNPEKVGNVVQIFATGAGNIPGAPPDGEAAPGAISTPVAPRVFVGNNDEAEVTYSGLAPGLVGVWQINVRIPATLPDGNHFVVVFMYDRPSGDPQNPARIVTTIAVKR